MSLSVNKLLTQISKIESNLPNPEGELFNPDIPNPSADFDERLEIRDKAFSALRLDKVSKNGDYFRLGKNAPNIDPRRDSFMQENSIDPNIIRKKINPDHAIPDLRGAELTKFSLVPSNFTSNDNVSLIQQARRSYVNYNNRFAMDTPPKEGAVPQMGVNYSRMAILPRQSKHANPETTYDHDIEIGEPPKHIEDHVPGEKPPVVDENVGRMTADDKDTYNAMRDLMRSQGRGGRDIWD